jgi:energy-coupling factor transport system ATP-binding protein
MDEVINADKVFVMEHGKVVMQGTPREIFTRIPEIKKYRLDVPQVTELAYELKMAGVDIPEGILSVDEFVQALEKLEA